MHKILLIEDDKVISQEIEVQLSGWDLDVTIIKDFKDVMNSFSQTKPHLVLIDIGLPFYDGYHWCREIRKVSQVPIIFISSASDNMNMVMAMNMGADDFIPKPFHMNVLLAKIQALLRRTYEFTEDTNILEHRSAILNLDDTTLHYRDKKIDLTKNEYGIIKTLMLSKGKVMARDKIIENLWESENFIDDNTLTVNITRLRKKLEDAGLSDFITTKKGIGYLIE